MVFVLPKNIRHSRVTSRSNVKNYPRLTFDQACDMVISGKKMEGCRDRTIQDYVKDWGYFKKWIGENYPDVKHVDEITTEMIRNYISYLKYDARRYADHKYINAENQRIGLKDTTINIRLRTYRAFFNFLVRDDLLEVAPRIQLLRTDIDLTNFLSDDEVKEILRQIDQRDFVGFRDYVGILTLLDTGMRGSELLGLRITDVDFKTRFITLNGTKTKNRHPRLIPFSTSTSKLLLDLHNENQQHFKTDRLFLSWNGDPIGLNHFDKRLKFYAEKAGIKDKKVTSHVYRHTWARNMTLAGADPFSIQKMGGWSDIRTMRRYVQIDTKAMQQVHDSVSPINKFRSPKNARLY